MYYSQDCNVYFAVENTLCYYLVNTFSTLNQALAISNYSYLSEKDNWKLFTFKNCKWLNNKPYVDSISKFIDYCIQESNRDSKLLYKYEYYRKGEHKDDFARIGHLNSPFILDDQADYAKVDMARVNTKLTLGSLIEDSSGMIGLVSEIDDSKDSICIQWNYVDSSISSYDRKSDVDFCLYIGRWKVVN